MKKIILLFALAIGMYAAIGQTILNASFENVNSPPCAYNLSNAAFNSVVSNVTAFGTYGDCDIIYDTCGYGTAHQGDWFIGLSVPMAANVGDAIAMELSSPLIAGQPYQFSFYQKRDAGYQSNYIAVGYSMNDTSQGTVFANFLPVAPSLWLLFSTVFTPTVSAQYITLSATPSVYGWNLIDDLSITNISGIDPATQNPQSDFTVYPNPASEFVVISSEFGEGDEIRITDVLGKTIFTKTIVSPISDFEFRISAFKAGVYFVTLSNEKESVTKKLVKQAP
ncbi:MAG: T9SS type A sorting domain-containing protein [Bacteroidia bacterium]